MTKKNAPLRSNHSYLSSYRMTLWSLYCLAGIYPDDRSRKILFTIPNIFLKDTYMIDFLIIRFTAKLHKYFNLLRTMTLFSAAILLGLATAATAGPEKWKLPFPEANPNRCSEASGCTLEVSYSIYEHSQSNDTSPEFHRCVFGCDRLMK